jgi:hypothetical protein
MPIRVDPFPVRYSQHEVTTASLGNVEGMGVVWWRVLVTKIPTLPFGQNMDTTPYKSLNPHTTRDRFCTVHLLRDSA